MILWVKPFTFEMLNVSEQSCFLWFYFKENKKATTAMLLQEMSSYHEQ